MQDRESGEKEPAFGSASYWQDEIKRAEKEREKWTARSKKIIKRYKDERETKQNSYRRFNVLWANIETLKPALYSATPVPVVVRRFKDADPVGRAASEILQRCLSYTIEAYDFDLILRQNITDYLLSGMATSWVRYEPEFEQVPVTDPMTGQVTGMEDQLSYEKVTCDYVHWTDLAFTKARTWGEVTWVGRRVYLTREEGEKRFGEEFERVPLDNCSKEDKDKPDVGQKKATVWEIWDKAKKKVVWIHPSYEKILDEKDPPIDFQNFFPCARPLLTTTANDSLIPVPDYVEYQDQAEELDGLTARINLLTDALRVAGVYNGGTKSDLGRLLNGDLSNKLVPVEDWATFMQSGGVQGAIQFLPIREISETLVHLYDARDRVKADLYEITGISDIIRGASQASETATAQRIKAQWGSIRLRDKQADVQRFVRDLIRLKAEVIAELFQPETLIQMSGIQLPSKQEETMKYQQAMQQYQMQAQTAQAQGQQPPPPPPEPKGPFMEDVIGLLREDKLRSYKIDIETDSTIAADEAQEKQDRTEFLTATTTFLQTAAQLLPVAPEMAPMFKDLMLFGVRSFRVGSSLEETIESSMDKLGERLSQPPAPQPDPNEAKKMEIETNAKLKQQEMGGNFQLQREKIAGDMALEREKLIAQEARNVNPFMGSR